MNQKKIREQGFQQMYSRQFHTISMAHEFGGTCCIDSLKAAFSTIYENDPIFRWNMPDNHSHTEDNMWEENSKEFQDELNKLKIFEVKQVQNLQEELTYIHNNSTKLMKYGDNLYMPLKMVLVTGYKDEQFTVIMMMNHIRGDGSNLSTYINFLLKIYSHIIKNEDFSYIVDILQKRICMSDEEYYQKGKPSFWRMFINNIKNFKTPFQDPGKYAVPMEQFERKLEDYYQRNEMDFRFVVSTSLDYSKIFQFVKEKYSFISKNSILLAFWLKFIEDYARNIKKSISETDLRRSKTTFLQPYRHLTQQEYQQYSGNYYGVLGSAQDVGPQTLIEELALKIHLEVQKNKEDKRPVFSQYTESPFLNNNDRIQELLKLEGRPSFFVTNWSNFELNSQHNTMMEGCKLLNTTCGSGFGKPVKYFPYFFLRIPQVINYIRHNNTVFHSQMYMNTEENQKMFNHLQSYHERFVKQLDIQTHIVECDPK